MTKTWIGRTGIAVTLMAGLSGCGGNSFGDALANFFPSGVTPATYATAISQGVEEGNMARTYGIPVEQVHAAMERDRALQEWARTHPAEDREAWEASQRTSASSSSSSAASQVAEASSRSSASSGSSDVADASDDSAGSSGSSGSSGALVVSDGSEERAREEARHAAEAAEMAQKHAAWEAEMAQKRAAAAAEAAKTKADQEAALAAAKAAWKGDPNSPCAPGYVSPPDAHAVCK